MANFTADFEAGTLGNNILAADAGSATAWSSTAGGSNVTYDNTHVAHGSKAAKILSVTGTYLQWDGFSGLNQYGRLYLYATANPTSNPVFLKHTSARWRLLFETNGKLTFYSNGLAKSKTTTNAILLNQWVRIEWNVFCDPLTGQVELKLFSGDSTTAIETATGTANWDTGNTSDGIQIGTQSFFSGDNWGSTIWIDDIVTNATSYPGPAVSAAPTNGLLAIL